MENQLSDISARTYAGLIAAQIAAAEEAKRYGHKLIYWEDGAIIEVAPEEILAQYQGKNPS